MQFNFVFKPGSLQLLLDLHSRANHLLIVISPTTLTQVGQFFNHIYALYHCLSSFDFFLWR